MKNIKETLNQLGIPAHLSGRRYIEEAVLYLSENPVHSGFMKEIYPKTAEKCGTTEMRTERCIRHAIEASCKNGDRALIRKIFGTTLNIESGKPKNSLFLSGLAEYIKED